MMANPDAPWTTHHCGDCGYTYHTQMNATVRVRCGNDAAHGTMTTAPADWS